MLLLSDLRVSDEIYYFKHAVLAIIIIYFSRMPFFFFLMLE